MKNIGFKGVVLAGAMVALSNGRGFSQDISSLTNGVADEKDQYFTPGFHEAGVGTGIFWSPIGSTYSRPRVDYVMGDVEIDYMLTHMFASGFWRNNFEVAVEGFGAGIYQNTGHYIAGGACCFGSGTQPRSPGNEDRALCRASGWAWYQWTLITRMTGTISTSTWMPRVVSAIS